MRAHHYYGSWHEVSLGQRLSQAVHTFHPTQFLRKPLPRTHTTSCKLHALKYCYWLSQNYLSQLVYVSTFCTFWPPLTFHCRPAMAALNEDRLEDIISKCERSGDWGLLRSRWGILKANNYFIFLHQNDTGICKKNLFVHILLSTPSSTHVLSVFASP